MHPNVLQHNASEVCHAIECGMPFFFHAKWTYTIIVLLGRAKQSPSLLGRAKPEVMVRWRLNNYNPSAYHLCILHGQIHTSCTWQDTYTVLHTLLHILLFQLFFTHMPLHTPDRPPMFYIRLVSIIMQLALYKNHIIKNCRQFLQTTGCFALIGPPSEQCTRICKSAHMHKNTLNDRNKQPGA